MKRMTWITLTGAFLIAGFTLSACNQKEAPNDAAAKLQSLEARLNASEARNNDIALATRCSEAAANFYKRNVETDKSPPGFSSSYKNHWNKKMQKCFVQIDSSSPNDNRLFTDLYDVFENKRYAMFLGHAICDEPIVKPGTCSLDQGSVWWDGDDEKSTDDIRVGFGGIMKGGIGDANTRQQFLDQIRHFMND